MVTNKTEVRAHLYPQNNTIPTRLLHQETVRINKALYKIVQSNYYKNTVVLFYLLNVNMDVNNEI
jgi:hypothetical protein